MSESVYIHRPVNRRKRYRPACFSGKKWSAAKQNRPRFKQSTRPHGVR